MLAESIIRIGRPIAESNLPNEQRIRWLTDVDSENCKNFFQHIFLVEVKDEQTAFHFLQLTGNENVGLRQNSAFPIFYPNGGNALLAQGIYPVPCYLMYDRHIKNMDAPESFAEEVIIPRMKKTVPYQDMDDDRIIKVSQLVANELSKHFADFVNNQKQLGILYIYDHSLNTFTTMKEQKRSPRYLWIDESKLFPGEQLYLDGDEALKGIMESKFLEAKSLGYDKNAVSTFTNQVEDEVVSIYNRFWLWLSPTWEMPRSIYWEKDEWTRGIKIDRKNYEAYLYGTQFLKQITVPITNSVLKEMFAPIMNVEAKRHMRVTSLEPIFGVPLVLPLVDGDSEQLYEKYRRILKKEGLTDSDLHLEILAGIPKIVPKVSNEHRLMLLYYSGDLSRGNMHVRMVIEDVIPSVASKLQEIINDMNRKELVTIRKMFQTKQDTPFYRTQSLPSLLSNAYGPGYIWSSMQAVFHREPIRLDRLYKVTAKKITELANKEDHWGMVDELIFHHMFIEFYKRYCETIRQEKKEVKTVSDWNHLLEQYQSGTIELKDVHNIENLGFISGLLLKQFSNSYQVKTGREFVKHRVMKFGSKLTPTMVWKNGLLRCEELKEQWELNLAGNFFAVLPKTLLAFIDADQKQLLKKETDLFMTAFWSGFLMYRKPKKEEE
ncbi:hypothetical protein N1I87_14790 [Bacillus sp. FSL W8-0102]|uniref:hypothetical protein n=1 Tax=Bacillus sp. FSL W8-0102 TaxID=2978205 RepID=UPI0030FD053D